MSTANTTTRKKSDARAFWFGAALTTLATAAQAGPAPSSYAALGKETERPFGWADFCRRSPHECRPSGEALDADVRKPRAWSTLETVNRWVNANIEPVTDQELYGVVELWTYPDKGKGDCEDYVLLKRKRLAEAGFPIQSLLITVVRDEKNEAHAVLTVKTTAGEYVLDNKRDEILPWTKTGYRFVKRQSQDDPDVWMEIGPPSRAVSAVAAIKPAAR